MRKAQKSNAILMKNEIRRINKNKRAKMSQDEVITKSNACSAVLLSSDLYKKADSIMLYIPLGNETDTSQIIQSVFADRKECIFPVTDCESGIITPCRADRNTEFVKGAFSVFEPSKLCPVKPEDIDLIIVPGIAFDYKGVRVGFGKGCYDRLLKQTRAVRVGYCYDFQLCECIEGEEHDISMDFLITESGLITCE